MNRVRSYFCLAASKRLFALAAACVLVVAAPSTRSSAQTAAPSSSPSSAGAPPAGGGGNQPAVESTALEYQAQAENAFQIAATIKAASAPGATFALVTNSDIGAIVQLKIVLGQASLLTGRLAKTTATINADVRKPVANQVFPCPAPVAGGGGGGHAAAEPLDLDLSGLFNPASNFQTIVQTLASIGAVNETVTAAPGALTDTTLINLVAGHLPKAYVPSVYPPNLLSLDFYPSSAGAAPPTALGKALAALENARAALISAADARMLTANCQAPSNAGTAKELAAEATALSGLVDSFEASLFGGQTPAPANANGGGNNGGGNSGGNNANATTPAPPTASAGTTLQQILYADLLLKSIPADSYIVSLHAAESGGSNLTKSNLFLGSRAYYSGSANATFSLYKSDGRVRCGGTSTAYRGFVQEKDIGTSAIMSWNGSAWASGPPPGDPQTTLISANDDSGTLLPPVAHVTTTCDRYAAGDH